MAFNAFVIARLQYPAFSIATSNEALSFRRIGHFHCLRIPVNLFAGAISDVAKVIGFSEPAGIFEIGTGGLAGFAALQPFFVMAGRTRDSRLRALETFKIFLGEQNVFAVIGEQHPLAADEEAGAVPLRNAAV